MFHQPGLFWNFSGHWAWNYLKRGEGNICHQRLVWLHLQPGKLTWQWNQPFEDASYIKICDFPLPCQFSGGYPHCSNLPGHLRISWPRGPSNLGKGNIIFKSALVKGNNHLWYFKLQIWRQNKNVYGGLRKFLSVFGMIGPLALRPCALLLGWGFCHIQ